jgi:hypothetical protein
VLNLDYHAHFAFLQVLLFDGFHCEPLLGGDVTALQDLEIISAINLRRTALTNHVLSLVEISYAVEGHLASQERLHSNINHLKVLSQNAMVSMHRLVPFQIGEPKTHEYSLLTGCLQHPTYFDA